MRCISRRVILCHNDSYGLLLFRFNYFIIIKVYHCVTILNGITGGDNPQRSDRFVYAQSSVKVRYKTEINIERIDKSADEACVDAISNTGWD